MGGQWVAGVVSDRIGIGQGKSPVQKTKAGGSRRRGHSLVTEKRANLEQLGRMRQNDGLNFSHSLEAASADVQAYTPPTLLYRCTLNIRPELPLRLALGEAHVVAAHRPLATYITFSHNFTLPDAQFDGVQIKGDQSVATYFSNIKNNPVL